MQTENKWNRTGRQLECAEGSAERQETSEVGRHTNNVCQRFPIPIRLWSNFINQKVSCLTSLWVSPGFPLRFNYVNPIAGTAVRTLNTWLTPSLIRSSYRYLYTILSIVVCRFFDLFSCHLRLERRLSITVCTTNVLRRAGVAGSARITLPALLATTKVSLNQPYASKLKT